MDADAADPADLLRTDNSKSPGLLLALPLRTGPKPAAWDVSSAFLWRFQNRRKALLNLQVPETSRNIPFDLYDNFTFRFPLVYPARTRRQLSSQER